MTEGPKLPKEMVEQLKNMNQDLLKAQEELANETVIGSAGGDAVRITLTGDQRCTEVLIDPELLKEGGQEMLQDLFFAAINSALQASRDLASDRLGPISLGLNL